MIVGHAESNQGFSIDGRRPRVNVRGGWCLKAALYDATDAVFGDFLLAAIKTGCRARLGADQAMKQLISIMRSSRDVSGCGSNT